MTVDFGVDTLMMLARKTHFPWLLSNVYDVTTEQPLAEGVTSHVITWQGRKVSSASGFCTQIANICLFIAIEFVHVDFISTLLVCSF